MRPVKATGLLSTRRKFMRLGGLSLAAGYVAGTAWHALAPAAKAVSITGLLPGASRQYSWRHGTPFALGVASGTPRADGFTLWTRLAPDPLLAEGGAGQVADLGLAGMPPMWSDIEIGYEVATDPEMKEIVRRGAAIAEAAYAFSVHLDIAGLPSGRPYWFRFISGDAVSRIGHARTLPGPDAPVQGIKIGVASCANFERGYFSAYRHLTAELPDLIIFLGDYIYEKAHPGETLRRHSDGANAATLAQYRRRHAQYRLDPDLQALHAAAPCLITWDDHEVQNDYAGDWSETFDDPATFRRRRAAAYQAFYEHMPLRAGLSRPHGAEMRIYDSVSIGKLLQIQLLDGRQYRSREACYGRAEGGGGHIETPHRCPELLDPARSMLGAAQEAWLYDGLKSTQAQWNIIAQDVLMAPFLEAQPAPEHGFGYATDRWDGYPANRQRLLQHIHAARPANPIVISGDIHSFWANDLHLNPMDVASPVVAHEFVGTSITSHGPDYASLMHNMRDNPHIRFCDSRQRGYMLLEVGQQHIAAHFRTVSDVTDPNATLATLRSFALENGSRDLQGA
ncbi:MAG TPA: alkaline phosphatase D family protein [Dongiaceae bacterium]|nr:alkaline phosphatase D family protein [Dongiaceae bacterium]